MLSCVDVLQGFFLGGKNDSRECEFGGVWRGGSSMTCLININFRLALMLENVCINFYLLNV